MDRNKQIISKQFNEKLTNNLQKDFNILIEIISTIIHNIYNIPTSTIKTQITRKILSIIRNNPKILYTNINNILKEITMTKQFPDDDVKQVISYFLNKGIMPSEYSLTNPKESWAEIISYASKNINNIPKELKNLLIGIISKII
jgi:hypothetical protein